MVCREGENGDSVYPREAGTGTDVQTLQRCMLLDGGIDWDVGMKQIEVVAAIIRKENQIFATQRGYGEWKDWWEFPGGKMEAGETPEEALKREIWEELETRIVVERLVETVEWDYPAFHLTMHCYLCHVESGHLELKEHEAAKWLNRDELESVRWLPADWEIVRKLKM